MSYHLPAPAAVYCFDIHGIKHALVGRGGVVFLEQGCVGDWGFFVIHFQAARRLKVSRFVRGREGVKGGRFSLFTSPPRLFYFEVEAPVQNIVIGILVPTGSPE